MPRYASILIPAMILALSLGLFRPVKATHIVGGELNYTQLPDNQYRIVLQLFVDCYNGLPTAIAQDTFAHIGIFNGFRLDRVLKVRRNPPIRLNKTYYNCIDTPGDVCVNWYVYDTIVKLPPQALGYFIAYQRCCRNHSILNLQNPGDQGTTFLAFIPGSNTTDFNSSPSFDVLPPNYLCNEEPLLFDHSATDPDGDSLVYRICTPLQGAGPQQPYPLQPANPPYDSVDWLSPFNDTNQLPTADEVYLNAKTGFLKFKPIRLGQYVFGVCVDEYRDSIQLGTVRRDYQFNVLPCDFELKAQFDAPDLICDGQLSPVDESFGNSGWSWDFGDPNSEDDRFSTQNPQYTFSDTGTYTLKLKVNDGNCSDSFQKTIRYLPDNYFRARKSDSVCLNDSLIFRGDAGIAGVVYSWSSKEDFDTLNDSTIQIKAVYDAGFRLNMIKDECAFYDSFLVRVYDDVANFQLQIDSHCAGASVLLDSMNKSAVSISWIINEDTLGPSPKWPIALPYREPIKVQHIARSGDCFDTSSIAYDALWFPSYSWEIPNIFTPNGDGYNECFGPKKEYDYVSCGPYTLLIFNRWGEKVFEVLESQELPCWDGNDEKGNRYPNGTYYWHLKMGAFDRHGTVSLLR